MSFLQNKRRHLRLVNGNCVVHCMMCNEEFCSDDPREVVDDYMLHLDTVCADAQAKLLF